MVKSSAAPGASVMVLKTGSAVEHVPVSQKITP